jgi:hypothetical protein
MTTFEFILSESFLIEAFRRARRCNAFTKYAVGLKIVLGLCLLGLILYSLQGRLYGVTMVLTLFLLLLIFGYHIDERMICRRFRKSPYRDERVKMELSENGLAATGDKSNVQSSWAVITSARQFDDGFLLFQGPGVYNWLPVSAIVAGNEQEVDDLIKTHVSDYKRA